MAGNGRILLLRLATLEWAGLLFETREQREAKHVNNVLQGPTAVQCPETGHRRYAAASAG